MKYAPIDAYIRARHGPVTCTRNTNFSPTCTYTTLRTAADCRAQPTRTIAAPAPQNALSGALTPDCEVFVDGGSRTGHSITHH